MFYITVVPIICVIIFMILFTDFDFTYTKDKVQHNIKLNGLIWCALNAYSRHVNNSDVQPLKFYTYTKTNTPL